MGGILDLKHPIIQEAGQGRYTINAKTDKGERISHGFDIREYGGSRLRVPPLGSTLQV